MVADAFSRCVCDNHSTKAYPIQAVAMMNKIVLTDEQYNTIRQFHNSTAGHAGIDRTVKRMHKAGISWPYLRELVRAYILRMCPVCQKMSYLKVPIIARRFTTTAAGPMEVLNMDYERLFPEDDYEIPMFSP